jgi:aspartyl-tRNA(Asn)/glutamyl-tRNA(Gln) amidotransferase subunit A
MEMWHRRSPSTSCRDSVTQSLAETVDALRRRDITARQLVQEAVECHKARDGALGAYKHFDAEGALTQADSADAALDAAAIKTKTPLAAPAPPLCGIPISVKDLYSVEGMPSFAGSARQLPPDPWSQDAWMIERLRRAGAVIVGKTHTVEFAYGGVGFNPHWGTPRNPWDARVPRIPGGSSCGAGVSLWEESAMVALGSDTGGSIRIPAAFTGVVGHKTTKGRWPTDGMVQLSTTFDTVGALTRSVEDSVHFFGSVDPRWSDPSLLMEALETSVLDGIRIALPECTIWEACQPDIRDVLESTLEEIESGGARLQRVVATMLDDAVDLYMSSGIGRAEINAFLHETLPEWPPILHPTVGQRLDGALPLKSEEYRAAIAKHRRMAAFADTLFSDADVLVLPANLITPPPVAEIENDLDRYAEVNYATLRPACAINLLELCAISIPVGLDATGMPVGLQVVGRGGDDELLLGVALAIERAIGNGHDRLGQPPVPSL